MDEAKVKAALTAIGSVVADIAARVPNGPETNTMIIAIEAAIASEQEVPGPNDLQSAGA